MLPARTCDRDIAAGGIELASKLPPSVPTWLLLASRLALFAAAQSLLALAFALAQQVDDPWSAAARWWPLTAAAANVGSFALLLRAVGGGTALRELLRFRRKTMAKDVVWLLPSLALAAAIAWLPSLTLSWALWGDANAGSRLLLAPLPLWAAVCAAVLFAPIHALTELPTYFFAATPALARSGSSRWVAVLLPAMFLGAQHAALPLLFDLRFAAWRVGMFLPFAVAVGLLLRARPTLLPYLVVVHALMDAQVPLLSGLVGAGKLML